MGREEMQGKGTLPLGKFDQIGVAVRSVDAAVQFLEASFGFQFITLEMPRARAFLRGREVEFVTKIGLTRVGDIDLELMEIVAGDHIVKECLEKRGPGLHHLGVYVEDLNAAVETWCAAGGALVQKTAHPDGIGTAYLDTEGELGNLYIELIKLE